MKSFLTFSLLFASQVALADTVNLSPGNSITIGRTTVTCGGAAPNPGLTQYTCWVHLPNNGYSGGNAIYGRGWSERNARNQLYSVCMQVRGDRATQSECTNLENTAACGPGN